MLCALAVATQKLPATEEGELSLLEGSVTESVTSLTTVLPALPASEEAFTAFTGVINGNRVRLRTAPRLDAHVVREIGMGELFAVVGETNEFYAVLPHKGTKGYVFRTFVLEGIVEGERVNVRLYPDIEAPVVAQLHVGEQLDADFCATNNKWLEIELSERGRFYISKEYIEKAGPLGMIAEREVRHNDAFERLSTALCYAQSEIQKPFEEIDLERVCSHFEQLINEFGEFKDITEKAKEMDHLMQDIYLQKKIAFLEQKADRTVSAAADKDLRSGLEKLSSLSKEIVGDASSPVEPVVIAPTPVLQEEGKIAISEGVTDKMLVWYPLEESLFRMWALVNSEKTMEEYYREEEAAACTLDGILESYDRPVKNRPGDFLLKVDNQTVGFLYSTKVNLRDKIGTHVTLKAAPRPNNNFAFPAYFVLSIE